MNTIDDIWKRVKAFIIYVLEIFQKLFGWI